MLSVGFVGISAEAMKATAAETTEHDRARHEWIAELIESTELRAMYDLESEHDFSAEPRAVDIDSAESLLAGLRAD